MTIEQRSKVSERESETELRRQRSTNRRSKPWPIQRLRLQEVSGGGCSERQPRSIREVLFVGQVVQIKVSAQVEALTKPEHFADSQIDVEVTPALIEANRS